MYTLTEHRFEKAKPILEKYRAQLTTTRKFDAGAFEIELRECLETGYREIKDIAIQLLDTDEYRLVAAWYMEHSNATGVVSEFHSSLSKLYGIPHYSAKDREEKQQAFWNREIGVGDE